MFFLFIRVAEVNSSDHLRILFGFSFLLFSGLLLLLFHGVEPESLVGWETDPGLLSLSEDHNVSGSGGENLAVGILDVDDIDGTWVLFDVSNLSNSSDVVSSDGIDDVSEVKLGDVFDGVLLNVELQSITDVDIWVWESESSGVMGDDVWVSVWSEGLLDDLDQLEFRFLWGNSLGVESSLDVIENSESIVGLLDGDDVHNSQWVTVISSNLSVNLNLRSLIVQDGLDFSIVEGILQFLLDQQGEGDTFSSLVWSLGWSNAVETSDLSKHITLGSSDFFLVLLWSSCHLSILLL